mmetsp:Transcript_61104/g.176070  ORF Transcript_61104/g.176070 Transcript_61104/m.176070 type:complete len:229 (-) Transcript_61104:440-1126(-)
MIDAQRDASKISWTSKLNRSMSAKAAVTTSSIFSLSSGRKHAQFFASNSPKESWICSLSSCSLSSRTTSSNWIFPIRPPMWTNVNNSITHQRRLKYVVPQKTTMRRHPLRKTGRQRRSSSMFRWSMQHLSIHTVGSRPFCATNSARQRCMAAHFAAASSCQECETNASQPLNLQGPVFTSSEGLGRLSAKSSNVRSASNTHRNLDVACARTSLGSQFPTRPATPAAAH